MRSLNLDFELALDRLLDPHGRYKIKVGRFGEKFFFGTVLEKSYNYWAGYYYDPILVKYIEMMSRLFKLYRTPRLRLKPVRQFQKYSSTCCENPQWVGHGVNKTSWAIFF